MRRKGFTIIEVVLVLAIAGLVFLMVFVAFPALQRNQRDTQRRRDYADLSAAVINAAISSNGNFPSGDAAKEALRNNIGNKGKDPEGRDYIITQLGEMGSQVDATISEGQIKIYKKATCGSTGNVATKGGSGVTEKQFVIFAYLESGPYCLEGRI